MTDSDGRSFVAGLNQSLRAIRSGKAKRVVLAKDADHGFIDMITKELMKSVSHVKPETELDSEQLAALAGVAVPTAIITFLE